MDVETLLKQGEVLKGSTFFGNDIIVVEVLAPEEAVIYDGFFTEKGPRGYVYLTITPNHNGQVIGYYVHVPFGYWGGDNIKVITPGSTDYIRYQLLRAVYE